MSPTGCAIHGSLHRRCIWLVPSPNTSGRVRRAQARGCKISAGTFNSTGEGGMDKEAGGSSPKCRRCVSFCIGGRVTLVIGPLSRLDINYSVQHSSQIRRTQDSTSKSSSRDGKLLHSVYNLCPLLQIDILIKQTFRLVECDCVVRIASSWTVLTVV